MFVAIIMWVITLWVLGLAIAFVHAHIFGIVVFLIATGILLLAIGMARVYICMAVEAGIWTYKKIKKIHDTDEDKLSRYTWRCITANWYVAEMEDKIRRSKELENSRYY